MNRHDSSTSFVAAAATILVAIMLYDVMGAIIKHLSARYPTEQLAFFRNLFGLIPTGIILFFSRKWAEAGKPLVIRQWKLGLIRGVVAAFAQLCMYLGIAHLEFATATTILFSGPLFVTALSIPLLGHRVGLIRWLAVITGFAGVLLVMQPTAPDFSWYALLPLLAALGFGSISVSAQRFDNSVPTALMNLYGNAGSLVCFVIMLLVLDSFVPILNPEDWLWLGAIGLAGGLAAYFLIAAYRLAEPSSLSPFEYFAIPFSFTLGWIFFDETPLERLFPGVLLIVGSGLYILWREQRTGEQCKGKYTPDLQKQSQSDQSGEPN